MKKRLIILLMALCLLCAFGLAACVADRSLVDCETAGHDFGDYITVVEPTCTTEGSKTRTCRNGAHTETVAIEPLGHLWGEYEVVKSPDAENSGQRRRVCQRDHSHIETSTISATGLSGHLHMFGDYVVTTPPTCTEDGEETRSCIFDSTHIETRPISATGHTPIWQTVIMPTETEDGREVNFCPCDPTNILGTRTAYATGTEGLEFIKALDKDEYRVSRMNGSASHIVIPAYYDRMPVTGIGFSAFMGNRNIVSIEFLEPTHITTIEDSAFMFCENLKTIYIPETVSYLGRDAFYGDNQLKITWKYNPDLDMSDYKDRLVTVSIPDGVKKIETEAFKSFSSVAKVDFSESRQLTSIGDRAFYECSSLTGVLIPSTVTSLGVDVFAGCDSLQEIGVSTTNEIYRSVNNAIIKTDTNKLIFTLDSYIPEGVVIVGERVFSDNTSLLEINIPTSVEHIENSAFFGCSNLQIIRFAHNNELKTIGNNAFFGCLSLRTIYYDFPATLTHIGDNAFQYCISLESVNIPANVTYLGKQAFMNCDSLKTVYCAASIDRLERYTFGDTVEELTLVNTKAIASDAFRNATKLKRLYIIPSEDIFGNRSSVFETIEPYAFYTCPGLESVYINIRGENNFKGIGAYAFASCTNLKTFDIDFYDAPNFKTIGAYAFDRCISLEHFGINSVLGNYFVLDAIENNAFSACISLKTTSVLRAREIGRGAFEQSGLPYFLLTKEVEKIGDGAFFFNDRLETFVFEKGSKITNINSELFKGCNNLKNLTISDEVESIGEGAFRSSPSLQNVYLPNGSKLKSIGDYAFATCNQLQSVAYEVGDKGELKLETIGKEAFRECSSLTGVAVGSVLISIGERAFEGCRKLESVGFPATLEYIGEAAFMNCDKFYSNYPRLTIPQKITVIEPSTFENCKELKAVLLPESMTTIKKRAFANCVLMASINIPASVTTIGDRAFYSCSSLKIGNNFVIPDYLFEGMGDEVFYNCASMVMTVTITQKAITFSKETFTNCKQLEVIIAADIKVIPQSLFMTVKGITKITFAAGSQLETIENLAFYSCSGLTEVKHYGASGLKDGFPDSLRTIGSSAFQGTNISSLVFNKDLETIGIEAFGGISALRTIRFDPEASIKKLEPDKIFPTCSGVEEIWLPKCTTYIQKGYLSVFKNLKRLHINGKTQVLEAEAFAGLSRLEMVDFLYYDNGKNDLTEIGERAFYNCNSLVRDAFSSSEIYLPYSVVSIGKEAFRGCINIVAIRFDNDPSLGYPRLETIGDGAFYGCSSLSVVALGNALRLTSIGKEAFYGDTRLSSLPIPKNVVSIGTNAFYNWSDKQRITLDGGYEQLNILDSTGHYWRSYTSVKIDIPYVGIIN